MLNFFRVASIVVIILFLVLVVLLYVLQTKLIFYPGKLSANYKFRLRQGDEEVFIKTADDEQINGLFYQGSRPEVILYFHGNAGDLSGWQFVAEDFVGAGYNILIIDYRGYGKSTGSISENGFYKDAAASYAFLIETKQFQSQSIIVYGRSIGTGVAVDLASKNECKGLVLESPYSSLGALANEKLPFFFPSLYLRFKFNNIAKINHVKCPVVFIHGKKDELIPSSHSEKLFRKFDGRKKLILVESGSHNDLNSFQEHEVFLSEVLPSFFERSNN